MEKGSEQITEETSMKFQKILSLFEEFLETFWLRIKERRYWKKMQGRKLQGLINHKFLIGKSMKKFDKLLKHMRASRINVARGNS